ncbi:hypothetical protein OH807_32085 [Kitasatospora sp. NBC_01560]
MPGTNCHSLTFTDCTGSAATFTVTPVTPVAFGDRHDAPAGSTTAPSVSV